MDTETMALGMNTLEARERYNKTKDAIEQLDKLKEMLGFDVPFYRTMTDSEKAIVAQIKEAQAVLYKEHREAASYVYFYEDIYLSEEYQSAKLQAEAKAWVEARKVQEAKREAKYQEELAIEQAELANK